MHGFSSLALEILEFISKTYQTHLNKLIKVFRITRKLQAGKFVVKFRRTMKDDSWETLQYCLKLCWDLSLQVSVWKTLIKLSSCVSNVTI